MRRKIQGGRDRSFELDLELEFDLAFALVSLAIIFETIF